MLNRVILAMFWIFVINASLAPAHQVLAHQSPVQQAPADAPSTRIQGKVLDKSSGEPVAGVRITFTDLDGDLMDLLETPHGAVSRVNGEFEIKKIKASRYAVECTAIGYKRFTSEVVISAGEPVPLIISLMFYSKALDEVVVTGVASRAQKSVAEIAVARVDAASLNETNTFQDISQLLTGKVAGVSVVPATGNVGGGIRFNVRSGGGLYGAGQPVIFVDGIRFDNSEIGFPGGGLGGGQRSSSLADLNPEDIQSIEVLKGPAASALYGTSGSNGVVLIKTKQGSRARANRITVDAKIVSGWNDPAKLYNPEQAVTFAEANALFRRGNILQYSLGVSGSTGAVNYYVSFDRRSESGIIAQNALERTSVRSNIEAFPSEQVSVKISANYVQNSTLTPQNDDNVYGLLNNTLGFNRANTYSNAFGNARPMNAQAALETIETATETQRFIGSAEINIKPFTGLTLRGVAGVDAANNLFRQVFPTQYPFVRIVNGQRNVETRRLQQINYDLSAAYQVSPVENLSSTTIIGAQLFSRKRRGFDVSVQNFATTLIDDIEAGREVLSANEVLSDEREAGVFVQEELSYDKMYFLSFGVRNDYASSVGAEAPNIFYPRASAAVRLDRALSLPEEINLLKVRAAYGQSGQLPGSVESIARYWGAVQSGYGVGATVQRIGNPALQPERIQELEFGAELEIANAYGVDFTYYLQNANNSIVDFINSPSTGLTATAIPRNVGRIRGWGFESNLYATIFRSNATELRVNLITNHSDNRVEDIGGAQPIFAGANRNVIAPGFPRSAFYLFRVIEPRFLPSGVYDYALGPVIDSTRSVVGLGVPLYTASLAISLRFLTDFTFSAMAETGLGHSVYNNTRMLGTNPARGANPEYNRLATQLGLSGSTNIALPTSIRSLAPVEGVERLTPNTPEYRVAADRFARVDHRQFDNGVEPADFLRIREVSLSYNASNLLQTLFGENVVRTLILTASARNVWLFTRYSGLDVEVSRDGSRSLSRGIDNYTLQQPRVVNFSLVVGF